MSKNCIEIGTSPALAEGWFRARLWCGMTGDICDAITVRNGVHGGSAGCDYGAERYTRIPLHTYDYGAERG